MTSLVVALAMSTSPSPVDDWTRYRARFIAAEGRVVDTGNGNVSHSEGQGYGMLLAVGHDDRLTFDRLWHWTHQTLRMRKDLLFAWRWRPGKGVDDLNNATDGDVGIAWALLRAADRWHVPEYRASAVELANQVLGGTFRNPRGFGYLLPGVEGFEHADGAVVNPSYWMFPAFDALGKATGRWEWDYLSLSGVSMLRNAGFGAAHLPPDWLRLSEPPVYAPGHPPRFGYDAVRVPLWALWGNRPEAIAAIQRYWTAHPTPPAWVDLKTGAHAPYKVAPGAQLLVDAVRAYPHLDQVKPAPLDPQSDYFDASLSMLTRLMLQERRAS